MKKSFLIVIIGMLSLGMSMNSCTSGGSAEEYETDSRDQFVGTWNVVAEGSINRLENGSIEGTETINGATTTINISKSGENDLLIDGKIYSVNGLFSSNTYTEPVNNNGYIGSMTYTSVGTLSVDNFTIVTTLTGTWTNAGRNGTFSGSVAYVLTK
ncbi:MAG: hypothetical protein ACI9SJ_002099 [Flavobacteriaceae bacterium]|jgi:hypothetical protein